MAGGGDLVTLAPGSSSKYRAMLRVARVKPKAWFGKLSNHITNSR